MAPELVQQLQGDWIREVVWRDELGSTNQLALELAEEGALACPSLIVAERQTQGRGRQGKSWFSDQGGLTCTFVLGPEQLPRNPINWSPLALVTGIAVAEAIEWWTAPAKALLKWPNDVYLAGKKVSGILVESIISPQPACAIGIGVNVTTDFSHAQTEVQQRGIAISEVANRAIDRWHFLVSLCERIESHFKLWSEDPGYYPLHYRPRCMLTGRQVVVAAAERIEGRCLGLSNAGGLLIEDARGKQLDVVSGEVLRWT